MPRIRDYSYNAASENKEEIVDKEPESEKIETVEDSEVKPTNTFAKKTEGAGVSKISQMSVHTQSSKADLGSIEKIFKPEKDLTPKYTNIEAAIKSIVDDGCYYEDYVRAEKAELLKSKEFVLAVIAQNSDRYYAEQTPKHPDWQDEEYLTARISYFFAQTKESVKSDENSDLAENLYNYLRKSSFSPESYQVVTDALKLVAKVNSARVASVEESERMKESLKRFCEGVNSALNTAKDKHSAFVKAENLRLEKLSDEKKELVGIIDAMKFDF